MLALENGIFNETTSNRMKELEIANKKLKEKITSREMLKIKQLDEKMFYDYLCSFKDLDYSLDYYQGPDFYLKTTLNSSHTTCISSEKHIPASAKAVVKKSSCILFQ